MANTVLMAANAAQALSTHTQVSINILVLVADKLNKVRVQTTSVCPPILFIIQTNF